MILNEKLKHCKEGKQKQRPRRNERECKKANPSQAGSGLGLFRPRAGAGQGNRARNKKRGQSAQAGFVDIKRPTPRRNAQCNKKSQAWLNDRRNLTFIAPLSLQTATIGSAFARGRGGASETPSKAAPTRRSRRAEPKRAAQLDPNRSQSIKTSPAPTRIQSSTGGSLDTLSINASMRMPRSTDSS